MDLEEEIDASLLVRGFLAEARGLPALGIKNMLNVETIPLVGVVDAKDTYDKVGSDTSTFGQQKALAFTVAWLRQQFRRPSMFLRWTSTENMFADAGTKLMDTSHLRRVLREGQWSIEYQPSFIKAVVKKAKATKVNEADSPPGTVVDPANPVLQFLQTLSLVPGWHFKDGVAIQVSRSASTFRCPTPRFSAAQFPIRSSYGLFGTSGGGGVWRQLEDKVSFNDMPNPRVPIGMTASVLVTFFQTGTSSRE
jgi:hypothetical protein